MEFKPTRKLNDYRPYWAECFGVAPFLPTTREEMDLLGWDSCDVIIVTGDAYVDHASFGMAVIGRVLEGHGFRVGIIAQPDWQNTADYEAGPPNLYFGVAAGNMDSMINRYTADRKIRKDAAYTPGNIGGRRPDSSVIVYSQRCREAFKDVPIVIGSIEASLRRLAHYDYWSDKVRRSILFDARADMLLFGNAERAIVELTHRLADGEAVDEIVDIRGSAFIELNCLMAGAGSTNQPCPTTGTTASGWWMNRQRSSSNCRPMNQSVTMTRFMRMLRESFTARLIRTTPVRWPSAMVIDMHG